MFDILLMTQLEVPDNLLRSGHFFVPFGGTDLIILQSFLKNSELI
jgi:hypothetical protein